MEEGDAPGGPCMTTGRLGGAIEEHSKSSRGLPGGRHETLEGPTTPLSDHPAQHRACWQSLNHGWVCWVPPLLDLRRAVGISGGKDPPLTKLCSTRSLLGQIGSIKQAPGLQARLGDCS